MVSQHFGDFGQPIVASSFHRLGYAQMQRFARACQQAVVKRIANQGVFEYEISRFRIPVDKIVLLHCGEPDSGVASRIGDGVQEIRIEAAPDHRCCLQQPAGGVSQPVEADGQHRLNTGGKTLCYL
jgi:hypothetical protein